MIIINFDSDIRSHCIHVFTAWVSLEFLTQIAITIISTAWQLASFHLQLAVLCCVPHLIMYTFLGRKQQHSFIEVKFLWTALYLQYSCKKQCNRKMLNENFFYSYLLIYIRENMCSMCILKPRQVTKNKCT